MRIGICDDDEQARAMVSDWLKTNDDIKQGDVKQGDGSSAWFLLTFR